MYGRALSIWKMWVLGLVWPPLASLVSLPIDFLSDECSQVTHLDLTSVCSEQEIRSVLSILFLTLPIWTFHNAHVTL